MPKIISAHELDDRLGDICNEIHIGKCIGLPTETVYGLAADATNGQAVARIFEMKGRPKFNPLIIHMADLETARGYGEFDPISVKLAEAFWPGPLTLVVTRLENTGLHPLAFAGLDTIAIRCPSGPAQEILGHCGRPLAAPSANKSGKISPTNANYVADQFSDTDLIIIDNGPSKVGLESTILKVDGDKIIILRPGFVTAEMIEEVTGIKPEFSNSGKIEAPGMMKSHYAPNASVQLNCETCDEGAALLAFGKQEAQTIFNLSVSGDLREAAANLYLGLKKLDETGVKKICVSPIPNEGLGVAINDRLQRASAPRNT
jgi:L-threonylcarbamoyladenylate synthase